MDLIRESSFAQYLTRQGIEQGLEQGLQESILSVLEIRFDLSVSHPLADRIDGVDDVQRLKVLLRLAVQVSSLDEFSQLLDQERN